MQVYKIFFFNTRVRSSTNHILTPLGSLPPTRGTPAAAPYGRPGGDVLCDVNDLEVLSALDDWTSPG